MKTYVFSKPPTTKKVVNGIRTTDPVPVDISFHGVTSVRVYPWYGIEIFNRYFPWGGAVEVRGSTGDVVFQTKDGKYVSESLDYNHHICIRKSTRRQRREQEKAIV